MKTAFLFAYILVSFTAFSQTDSFYLLRPDRVFDGEQMHNDWIVLVKENKIEAAGSITFKLPANTRIIE